MKSKQVKSKKRVADHGEVFTSEREVNGMLDLIKQETERIESRFLEPACGTGNFLAEILNRKLKNKFNRRSSTDVRIRLGEWHVRRKCIDQSQESYYGDTKSYEL